MVALLVVANMTLIVLSTKSGVTQTVAHARIMADTEVTIPTESLHIPRTAYAGALMALACGVALLLFNRRKTGAKQQMQATGVPPAPDL